jgi:hypothetical protein
VLAIGADANELSEFREVFGMRFLGLIDPSSGVYNSWRVPDPTAPYPQDYIIDQQGRVAYWNDQYDPQAVIATIDRLLGSGAEEAETHDAPRPTHDATIVHGVLSVPASGLTPDISRVLLDAAGRRVLDLRTGGNDVSRLAPGVYFVSDQGAGVGGRGEVRKVVIQR